MRLCRLRPSGRLEPNHHYHGGLIEPGEVVAAGEPIAVMADLSTVKLKIFIDERDLGKVRLGAPVRIRIDAFPGRDFEARVARVDAQAQFTPRDVQTREDRADLTYGVKVRIHDPQGRLPGGTTVEVSL